MQSQRIGSVLVADADSGAAVGILTRHDVLGRITLPGLPLSTPIGEVMSRPVHSLGLAHTAQDAALLMSRHGIRHVPVADDSGRIVGMLSERDLFALQRLSLKQVSTALRAAADVPALQQRAADIRRFARNLLGQGVHARQLTELISHLNDLLTERLVMLIAAQRGIDLASVCWLAFGSEGRSEQTIATDQDNGIVFISDDVPPARARLLAFAREVNDALDACGYPLCKGNVMASNPACCLTQAEWLARFASWIDHGAPEDLLHASIYFDLRPVAGAAALTRPLRERIGTQARRNPRFLKQMADNALRNGPALTWTGAIDTRPEGDRRLIDLKLHGSAIYVDAARLLALAHGIAATGTRARFEAAAQAMRVPAHEAQAWSGGFDVLQMMRLQVQQGGDADEGNPNLLDVSALNDIDRRVLKESLRVARRLQQRIEMDLAQ
jgi:CBS domain-containing protein